MNKTCSICKCNKPIDEFTKNKAKKDGHNHTCKLCQKERSSRHYYANKSYYLNRNKEQAKKSSQYVAEQKLNKKCICCPETEPCCLEFHHLDENEKKYTISKMITQYSASAIEKEMTKCILICANCHRKYHAGKLSKKASLIIEKAKKIWLHSVMD